MAGKDYIKIIIAALLAGAIGGFAVVVGVHMLRAGGELCTAPNCLRDWLSATSGWAATVAAIVTILLLQVQLSDARKSGERQHRAYLTITETKVCHFGTADFELQVVIKNCGQTPARDCRFDGSVIAGDPKAPPPVVEMCVPYGVIGPGVERTIHIAPGADIATLLAEGFDAQACHIIIKGDLCYTDVFNHQRCTKFKVQAIDMLDIRSGRLTISADGHDFD